jgi:hypothetical protein
VGCTPPAPPIRIRTRGPPAQTTCPGQTAGACMLPICALRRADCAAEPLTLEDHPDHPIAADDPERRPVTATEDPSAATPTHRLAPRTWHSHWSRRVPLLYGTRPGSRPALLPRVCGVTWEFVTRYGALDGREERGEGDSDLRAARPDDGRDNGSPRPVPGSERGREGRPAQLWGRRKWRAGQPPVGAGRHATRRNPRGTTAGPARSTPYGVSCTARRSRNPATAPLRMTSRLQISWRRGASRWRSGVVDRRERVHG